jgi:hypothetical protein
VLTRADAVIKGGQLVKPAQPGGTAAAR